MTPLHVSRNWLVPLDALDAASPKGPAAPYWLDLDREAYAAQLAELKQWVDTVLRPNYGGYELLDCWPSHIHVIWELSTLAAAEWYRTYTGELPDLPRALEFYDRWLPGTMRRVSEYTRACIGQCSVSRRLPYHWTGRYRRLRMTTKATSPGVRRTLASSRRSRRLVTLPTRSGPGRLSLYRSAMRSRST